MKSEWDHRISAGVKGPADCIRIDEVAAALKKKMKRHKASGLSGLVAEFIFIYLPFTSSVLIKSLSLSSKLQCLVEFIKMHRGKVCSAVYY